MPGVRSKNSDYFLGGDIDLVRVRRKPLRCWKFSIPWSGWGSTFLYTCLIIHGVVCASNRNKRDLEARYKILGKSIMMSKLKGGRKDIMGISSSKIEAKFPFTKTEKKNLLEGIRMIVRNGTLF